MSTARQEKNFWQLSLASNGFALGCKLIIRSDHAALSYLRKAKELVAQQASGWII